MAFQPSPMTSLDQSKLLELQRRLELRESFEAWCLANLPEGQAPALHHRFIIENLQRLVKGQLLKPDGKPYKRMLIMLPPGSAKSTYTSWLFVPWYLNTAINLTILATSHSYDLVESFGRRCRNLIDLVGKWLGYSLTSDSKAAGSWATTNGGQYYCAGVNAGIAGRRADLGLIDDPIGDEMQAQSKLFRDRLWEWYHNDFVPRLKPQAIRILICNRRHEDDLAGRLTNPKQPGNEADDWFVLSIPMEAEENDVLGRTKGQRLWPEWFTDEQVTDAKKSPSTWAGLYQQHPTPESGDFFKREWIVEYNSLNELPKNLRIYVTSDHACSTERGANLNCFLPFGIDEDNHLWILPDIFWQTASPLESVEAMFAIVERRRPIKWRAEKGHISKSLRPLIEKLMQERGTFFVLEEITAASDKRTRCGSIAGRMQQRMVHFPSFASWYADALHEMMTFTGSGDDKADDFCDALGHAGMMLLSMTRPTAIRKQQPEPLNVDFVPTMGWMKESSKRMQSSNREQWGGR